MIRRTTVSDAVAVGVHGRAAFERPTGAAGIRYGVGTEP